MYVDRPNNHSHIHSSCSTRCQCHIQALFQTSVHTVKGTPSSHHSVHHSPRASSSAVLAQCVAHGAAHTSNLHARMAHIHNSAKPSAHSTHTLQHTIRSKAPLFQAWLASCAPCLLPRAQCLACMQAQRFTKTANEATWWKRTICNGYWYSNSSCLLAYTRPHARHAATCAAAQVEAC